MEFGLAPAGRANPKLGRDSGHQILGPELHAPSVEVCPERQGGNAPRKRRGVCLCVCQVTWYWLPYRRMGVYYCGFVCNHLCECELFLTLRMW